VAWDGKLAFTLREVKLKLNGANRLGGLTFSWCLSRIFQKWTQSLKCLAWPLATGSHKSRDSSSLAVTRTETEWSDSSPRFPRIGIPSWTIMMMSLFTIPKLAGCRRWNNLLTGEWVQSQTFCS
jgi:hypothetical protein